jgi:hypothetical protein
MGEMAFNLVFLIADLLLYNNMARLNTTAIKCITRPDPIPAESSSQLTSFCYCAEKIF